MLDRDCPAAVRLGQQAIALAERFDDRITIAAAENVIGSALLVSGDEGEGIGPSPAQHRARDTRPVSIRVVGNGHMNIGASYGEQYRLADAERHIAEGIAYTAERDLDYANHYMHAWLALMRLYQGRWSEAAEIATGLLARPNLSVISRIMALVALGRVRARRGDADVDAVLDEALELATQTGHAAAAGAGAGRARRSRVAGGRRPRAAAEAAAAYPLGDPALSSLVHRRAGAVAQAGRRGDRARRHGRRRRSCSSSGATGGARRRPGKISAASTSRRARWPTATREAQIAALEIFIRLGAAPAAAALRQRMRSPACARSRAGRGRARGRTRSASPPASCRSSTACRAVSPTTASAPSCMSRPRRSTITCRRCCPSWAPPRAAEAARIALAEHLIGAKIGAAK